MRCMLPFRFGVWSPFDLPLVLPDDALVFLSEGSILGSCVLGLLQVLLPLALSRVAHFLRVGGTRRNGERVCTMKCSIVWERKPVLKNRGAGERGREEAWNRQLRTRSSCSIRVAACSCSSRSRQRCSALRATSRASLPACWASWRTLQVTVTSEGKRDTTQRQGGQRWRRGGDGEKFASRARTESPIKRAHSISLLTPVPAEFLVWTAAVSAR